MAITTCKWKIAKEDQYLSLTLTPATGVSATLKSVLWTQIEQELGPMPTGTTIDYFLGSDGVTYASVRNPQIDEVVYYLECSATKIPWLGVAILGGSILLTVMLMRGSKKAVTW